MRLLSSQFFFVLGPLLIVLFAGTASATTVKNGNFSSFGPSPFLPTDYQTQCIGACNTTDTLGRISVEGRATDPYLQLTSAPVTNLGTVSFLISQTVMVMSGASLLSFDIGIDDSQQGSGGGSQLLLEFDDLSTPFRDLIQIVGFNRDNFILQPLGNGGDPRPGFGIYPATVTDLAPGGLFSKNVTVDLSLLAGKNVSIDFRLFNSEGDYSTTYNIDNIAFLNDPVVVDAVPLPAPILFLMSGLFALRPFRRTVS